MYVVVISIALTMTENPDGDIDDLDHTTSMTIQTSYMQIVIAVNYSYRT